MITKKTLRLNVQQSMNRINNLNPDIERTKNAVVEATTVEEFVTATNASLKLRETFLNKLINSSAETEVE